uniref:PDZ domain-containing protein n=1 Tax=Aegilops tauschii subsp. strangulata TaxID=200361 RepID=A0A453QXB0_AEGTS
RLHIGMKLSPIKFLDPIHVERIFRKCNIDSGLIVKEVSHGSIAEELGVRPGDVVDSVNGECVATTVEVGILHMRKGRKGPRHTLSLRLNVSDDVEVFISDF